MNRRQILKTLYTTLIIPFLPKKEEIDSSRTVKLFDNYKEPYASGIDYGNYSDIYNTKVNADLDREEIYELGRLKPIKLW